MKKCTMMLLISVMLLGLCACGSTNSSVESAAVSAAATSETESGADSAAEEVSVAEEDSVEETSVIEEAELTTDEMFATVLENAKGICLKLQLYNRKGIPIKAADIELVSEFETDQDATDNKGFVFLSDLTLNTDYTLSVFDDDGQVGSVTFRLVEGDTYGGSEDDDGILEISVADGADSIVDLAMTGTSDNGDESAFELSRISAWNGVS